MSLETDFFKKKRVRFECLTPYGFRKVGNDYLYQEKFAGMDFEAQIKITPAGQVFGRVIDMDTGEDYLALRVKNSTGTFVGEIRKAYVEILGKIADACFEDLPFVTDQANRLAQYLEQTYADAYDHPFQKYPDFASYRYPANHKWYALIMTVKRQKLDFDQKNWTKNQLEQEVEIINLKVRTDDLKKLLEIPGIYPSYHMSKKSWISIIFDEKVDDDFLFPLVDNSRALVSGKGLANLNGPDFWIVPANLKYYDIDKEFAESPINTWSQKASIQPGDYLFIYITAPTRALRYVCKVLETDIRQTDSQQKKIRIQLLKQYNDEDFPMALLKQHGVTNIRGPRRMTSSLIEEVKKDLPH